MRRGEVGLLREWAAAEGWNPGLYDAACFYETDPDGFFLGELDGEPIACLSCVAYDDSFGFVGHYIVRPEFRGLGHGIQVWRAGMARLGTRNVGFDGVLAQVGNYGRSGLRHRLPPPALPGSRWGAAAPGLGGSPLCCPVRRRPGLRPPVLPGSAAGVPPRLAGVALVGIACVPAAGPSGGLWGDASECGGVPDRPALRGGSG
jgi:hypothetical protein